MAALLALEKQLELYPDLLAKREGDSGLAMDFETSKHP